jgi:hypothetical protein
MKSGTARCKTHPYAVCQLGCTFFKDYENLRNDCQSIRPGRKARDHTVAEIRAIKYVNGEVFYKTRYTNDWKQLPQRRTKCNKVEYKQLYHEPLKIEQRKYGSLQKFKSLMLKEDWLFYDSLRHD